MGLVQVLKVYRKTHGLCKTAIVTRTSFVTCSRPGGASESEREKRERGGVHQLRQRGHARGEDSGGRAGGGAQNGDVHRDQPQRAVQLGELALSAGVNLFHSDQSAQSALIHSVSAGRWGLSVTEKRLEVMNNGRGRLFLKACH